MKCRNCGANTQGKLICPICGAKNIGVKKCHVCETTILPGMRECPNCGTPFHVEKNSFDHIPEPKQKSNTLFDTLKQAENFAKTRNFSDFKEKSQKTYQSYQRKQNYSKNHLPIGKWMIAIIIGISVIAILGVFALNFLLPYDEYEKEVIYNETSSLNNYDYNFSRGGEVFSDGYYTYISGNGTYINKDYDSDAYLEENYTYFGRIEDHVYALNESTYCYVEVETGEVLFPHVKKIYNYDGYICYLTLDNDLYRYDYYSGESQYVDQNVDDFLVDYMQEYVVYEKSGQFYLYSETDGVSCEMHLPIASLKDAKTYIQDSTLFYEDGGYVIAYSLIDEETREYISIGECDAFYYNEEDGTTMVLDGTTLYIDDQVYEEVDDIYFKDDCLVTVGNNCYQIYDYVNNEAVYFYER